MPCAAYLLIALIFSAAYTCVDVSTPDSFNAAAGAASRDVLQRFIYFSFATQTTVGYGDIVPVHAFARSLAMMQALIGQMFPSILLARLVSMEISSRQQASSNRAH